MSKDKIKGINIYLDNDKTVYCEAQGSPCLERLLKNICEETIIEFRILNLVAEIPMATSKQYLDYLNSKKVIGIKIIKKYK